MDYSAHLEIFRLLCLNSINLQAPENFNFLSVILLGKFPKTTTVPSKIFLKSWDYAEIYADGKALNYMKRIVNLRQKHLQAQHASRYYGQLVDQWKTSSRAQENCIKQSIDSLRSLTKIYCSRNRVPQIEIKNK